MREHRRRAAARGGRVSGRAVGSRPSRRTPQHNLRLLLPSKLRTSPQSQKRPDPSGPERFGVSVGVVF